MNFDDRTDPAEQPDGKRTTASAKQARNGETEPPRSSEKLFHRLSRRTFVAGFGGTAALFALGGVRLMGDEVLVRPPGGQNYDRLIGRCLRCGKCMEACPQKVIKMAGIEEGIVSQRMPKLVFQASYCTWCDSQGGEPLCVEVCPTGALELTEGQAAENTILGIAELNTTTCLAYRDIGCRFCYDACSYEAMKIDDNNRPVVIAEKCNGCGACEAVCVSLQNGSISSMAKERAIVVRPLDSEGKMVGSIVNEVH